MKSKRAVPTLRWAAAVATGLVLAAPLAAQDTQLTVTGEVRLRTEAFRPMPTEEWDNFTLMRTRLGLLAAVNPNIRAFVQFQDARVFGDQPTTMTGVGQAIDLHQGYIELSGTPADLPLTLRAGRQEIILGTERLVGAVGWSNIGRSFDAARLMLGNRESALSTTAFIATVHEGGTRFGGTNGQNLDADHWFTGVQTVWKNRAEAYFFYDQNAHSGIYRHIDRATLGGRLQAPALGRFTGSLEAAYQLGSQTARPATGTAIEQDIQAWFTGVRLGLDTGVEALPALGLGLDVLSGGETALGTEYKAFNTLYATNHKFYGYMDLFLDPAARTRGRGLIDAIASAKAGLGRFGTLEIDYHQFLLSDDSGLDSRNLGWELDLTYPFRIAGAGRFTVGYSIFRNGPAAPVIGLGDEGKTWHWGFVQAGVSF
jgi:hypothetical protein